MQLRALGAWHRPDENRIDHQNEAFGFERLPFFLVEPLPSAFHFSPVPVKARTRIISSGRRS